MLTFLSASYFFQIWIVVLTACIKSPGIIIVVVIILLFCDIICLFSRKLSLQPDVDFSEVEIMFYASLLCSFILKNIQYRTWWIIVLTENLLIFKLLLWTCQCFPNQKHWTTFIYKHIYIYAINWARASHYTE